MSSRSNPLPVPSQSIDVSNINLYDAMDVYGESDLILRGATTGDVGSANFVYSDVKEAEKQKQ